MKTEISIGDTFYYWEVIKVAEKRSVNEYYLCKCKCGETREVFRGSLLGGRSKSCGCRANTFSKEERRLKL
jgi:hypothetical protein